MKHNKIVGNTFVEETIVKLDLQGYPLPKIRDYLSLHNIKVSSSGIWQFLNIESNQATISQLRTKLLADPSTVPLYHKKVRLEDLNTQRTLIINTIKRLQGENDYIPSKKISKFLSLTKRLIEIEIAGREEVERRPDLLAMFQRTGPLKEVSDGDLLRELQTIDQKLIILRRGSQDSKTQDNPGSGAPKQDKGKPA